MARVALSSALVSLIKRKSYSTASAATAERGSRECKAASSSSVASNSASTYWVPDPVTGYYKPGNKSAEIDPAEMRARLLSAAQASRIVVEV